jgi:hypothetical protein
MGLVIVESDGGYIAIIAGVIVLSGFYGRGREKL